MSLPCLVFDIDGTLTKARTLITPEHRKILEALSAKYVVCLVTGSDYTMALEQIPESLMDQLGPVFTCSGAVSHYRNELWEQERSPEYPAEMIEFLEYSLGEYTQRADSKAFGTHFEYRTGMLNFSLVGRSIPYDERPNYVEYDKIHNDRAKIVDYLSVNFPQFCSRIGGEISIDISLAAYNKSMIVSKLDKWYVNNGLRIPSYIFFGNKIIHGGNDAPLAEYLTDNDRGFSVQAEFPRAFDLLTLMVK